MANSMFCPIIGKNPKIMESYINPYNIDADQFEVISRTLYRRQNNLGFNDEIPGDKLLNFIYSDKFKQLFDEQLLVDAKTIDVYSADEYNAIRNSIQFVRKFTNLDNDENTIIGLSKERKEGFERAFRAKSILSDNFVSYRQQDGLWTIRFLNPKMFQLDIKGSDIRLFSLDDSEFLGKTIKIGKIGERNGEAVEMRNPHDGTILVDLDAMRSKYKSKSWKFELRSMPLSNLIGFDTFEQFVTFALIHEVIHDKIKINENESNFHYETRINNAASHLFNEMMQNESVKTIKITPGDFSLADTRYNAIRNYFKDKIRKSEDFEKTHEYIITIDGKEIKANLSASQYARKSNFSDDSPYKKISTTLGNINDDFGRDYFSGNLKESYPNLTKGQYEVLKNDYDKFVANLNKRFGVGNWKIYSEPFPMYTKIKNKYIAGEPDLLLATTDGKFYVIDMKAKRGKRVNLSQADIEQYTTQVSLYGMMLESVFDDGFRVSGYNLLVSQVTYSDPWSEGNEKMEYENDNSHGEIYVVIKNKETDDVIVKYPLSKQNSRNAYTGIRLYDRQDFLKDITKESKMEIARLVDGEEETELTEEQIKEIIESIDKLAESNSGINPNDSIAQDDNSLSVRALTLNKIIPSAEIQYLVSQIVGEFTRTVNELIDPKTRGYHENIVQKFNNIDWEKTPREKILENKGLVQDIIEEIKSGFLDSSQDEYYSEETRAKWKIAYDNFDLLVESSRQRFLHIESLPIKSHKTKIINSDVSDETIDSENDSGTKEEQVRETWIIGHNNIPPITSIMGKLRRTLSTLINIDGNNYGYDVCPFANENEVINTLLKALKNCNTYSQMRDKLESLKSVYSYIEGLTQELDSDKQLQSQFFKGFRKDWVNYSYITVKTDSITGKNKIINQIINTTPAVDIILNELNEYFYTREGEIFDKEDNTVDLKKIAEYKRSLDKLSGKSDTVFVGQTNEDIINSKDGEELYNGLKTISNVLSGIGIRGISVDNIKTLIINDNPQGVFRKSQLSELISEMKSVVSMLIKNFNSDEGYNPMDSQAGIRNRYRKIATKFNDIINAELEASTYSDGKMYYSFVPPSYLGQLMNDIITSASDEEYKFSFMDKEFNRFDWFVKNKDEENSVTAYRIQWLNDMLSDPSIFEHKIELTFNGKPYKELSDGAYAASLLHEFFFDRSGKRAWYRVPTLSNKPSSEFIKGKRYKTDKNGKDELLNQLYDVFCQEALRIRAVVERYETVDDDNKILAGGNKVGFDIPSNFKYDKQIKNILNKIENNKKVLYSDLFDKATGNYIFEGTGAEFKFLDFLQYVDLEDKKEDEKLKQFIVDTIFNDNIEPSAEGISLTRRAIEMAMDRKVERTFELFDELQIIDEIYKVTNLKDLNTPEERVAAAKKTVEEYVWNDYVATINIIEITTTDLAYYIDSIDFQKRYAEIHSPGLRLNRDAELDFGEEVIKNNSTGKIFNIKNGRVTDGYLRTITIASKIVPSDIKQEIDVILSRYYDTLPNDPKNQEQQIQRKRFLEIKEEILKAFDEIDVTDGQAYSCPTSYRKKLVAAGEWNDESEVAYREILKGNFNLKDLGVIWQPQKPFVYTQLDVDGKSSTMSRLKTPTQYKNSEYLLLVADALLRGANSKNALLGIMDFMESTHYDNAGNYKTNGIDTITFDSAIKVSIFGVVDINNKTRQEVFDTLKYKAYFEDGTYNPTFVKAYEIERYAVQQVLPAHFANHNQPIASQLRALTLGDLLENEYVVNGRKYTAQEFANRYQKLNAANIVQSYDDLIKLFNIEGKDKIEKNKKLSKLLLEEIDSDIRYGADFRKSVMLNMDGDFVVPLDEAIQSDRIQRLINSIVRNRISKQYFSGGPIVQVSSFGLSDKINIRFKDSNGKILMTFKQFCESKGFKYSTDKKSEDRKNAEAKFKEYLKSKNAALAYVEAIAPMPGGAIEEALRLLADNNDYISLAKAKELGIEIDDDCLAGIATRIPVEDDYSTLPIKIVGFMPKSAGEGFMLPEDITLIGGEDFDGDKKYVLMKDCYIKINHNIDKLKEGFDKEERIRKKQKIKEYILSKGVNPEDLSKEQYQEYYAEYINANRESYNKTYNKRFSDFIEKHQREKQYISSIEVHAYRMNNDDKNEDVNIKNATKQERDNEIFDMIYARHLTPTAFRKMINPQSFANQERAQALVLIARDKSSKLTYEDVKNMTLKQLQSLIKKYKRNICDVESQIYYQKQNMVSAKLIGMHANVNVAHPIINRMDVYLTPNANGKFKFNGIEYSDEAQRKLDVTFSYAGNLVSKNCGSYVGADADAAKKPTMADMNIDTHTINQAMLLIRCGHDPEEVAMLTAQPIIVDIANRANRHDDNSDYPANMYRIATDSMVSRIFKENNYQEELNSIENDKERYERLGEMRKEALDIIKDFEENLYSEEFDINDLFDNIKEDNFEYSIKCAILFRRLISPSDYVKELSFITKFNSLSNAPHGEFTANFKIRERVDKFFDMMTSDSCELSQDANNILSKNPLLNAIYDTTIDNDCAQRKIAGNEFMTFMAGFSTIQDDVQSVIGRKLSEDGLSKLYKFIQLYNLYLPHANPDGSNESIRVMNPASEKNGIEYYLLEFPNEFIKQINYIEKNIDQNIKNNKLIEKIRLVKPDITKDDEYVDMLEFKTGSLNSIEQEEVRAAWTDLVLSDFNEIRTIGTSLFLYNLVRSGVGFSPLTFNNLATVEVKYAVKNYIDIIRNKENLADIFSVVNSNTLYSMLLQFFRNNISLIPSISNRINNYMSAINDGFLVEFDEGNIKDLMNIGVITEDNNETISTPMIMKYNNELYFITNLNGEVTKIHDYSDGGFLLQKTSRLGIPTQCVEIDVDADGTQLSKINPIMESALQEKRKARDEMIARLNKRKTKKGKNRIQQTDAEVMKILNEAEKMNFIDIPDSSYSEQDIDFYSAKRSFGEYDEFGIPIVKDMSEPQIETDSQTFDEQINTTNDRLGDKMAKLIKIVVNKNVKDLTELDTPVRNAIIQGLNGQPIEKKSMATVENIAEMIREAAGAPSINSDIKVSYDGRIVSPLDIAKNILKQLNFIC